MHQTIDTEAARLERGGKCIEPIKAWHDKRGQKSLNCARRAMVGQYCTQHAKRHTVSA